VRIRPVLKATRHGDAAAVEALQAGAQHRTVDLAQHRPAMCTTPTGWMPSRLRSNARWWMAARRLAQLEVRIGRRHPRGLAHRQASRKLE